MQRRPVQPPRAAAPPALPAVRTPSVPAREFAIVLAHLTLWSQLGVLTRVFLDKVFADGCTGGWGVCLTSTGSGASPYGAYFPDLPANALGSFLMGLLAASSTLTLGDPKPLAALPATHPWQAAPELHIGLRTGFCGSLTTLSSWAMALTLQLVGGDGRKGGRVAQWGWGWVVGLHLALGSYTLGEHAARLLDDRARPKGAAREAARAVRAVAEEEDRAAAIGASAAGGVVGAVSVGGEAGAALPPTSWADAAAAAAGAALAARGEVTLSLSDLARHHAARPAGDHGPAARAAVAGRVAALRLVAAAERSRGGRGDKPPPRSPRRPAPALQPPPPPPTLEVSLPASKLAAVVAGNGAVVLSPSGRHEKKHSAPHPHHPHHHLSRRDRLRSLASTLLGTRPDAAVGFVTRTHIAVGILGASLWVGAAVAVALDGAGGSEARRARWGAVLLAPPGCMLRWRLAPFNYRLRGRLASLPAGTLAANALGCLCSALLSVVAVRALPPVGDGGGSAAWGRVTTRAAQAGFCGALSTVSTLMAEAASQLRRVPADASGYAYLGLTWGVAVVVTVVAYGPAVWA